MEALNDVGIAISTTKKRKENWHKLQSNFMEFMPNPSNVHFDFRVDEKMEGVAFSKNASLRKLYDLGCKYFFLFDDDVWLKRKGFFHWVYRVHKQSGVHHFTYLNTKKAHKKHIKSTKKIGNHTLIYSTNGSGCFMFLTRQVLDKIGGYDTDFEGYGYNHLNYSMRIHNAFNQPLHQFITIDGMETFLHCQDFDGRLEGVKKKQTLTKAQKDKWIKKNNPLYKQKISNLEKYQPF